MKELITDKNIQVFLSDYVTSFNIAPPVLNFYITIEETSHEEVLLS
jgi:hypothetical protein